MTSNVVLIIEDEREIADLQKIFLESAGYTVVIANDGKSGLQSIEQLKPSLVLLDLMLPDMSGLDICKSFAKNPSLGHVPIIIVSALGEEGDIVRGLELGAMDYITKPFSSKVLVARVRAALRRDESSLTHIQSFLDGQIIVNDEMHQVFIDHKEVELTRTEFDLLKHLVNRPGYVKTRTQIAESIHGSSYDSQSRTIDVHVNSLRKKLGVYGKHIQTVRGVGYRFSER